MKNNDMRRTRVLYGKLLRTITLCISLTFLVSTFVYYTYYIGVEKTQTFRSDLKDLTQTGKKVVNMAEVAQTLSFQLYRTSTISHLLFYNEPSIYEVTAAMSDLGNYLNSMPYIESIYVYNPNNDTIYISAAQGQNGVFTREELVDKQIISMLEHYQDYRTFTPIPRTYSLGKEFTEEIPVYTYLCYDAINWDRAINSAVIVNISASWINRELAGGSPEGEDAVAGSGTTYILDDQGRFLSGSGLTLEPLAAEENGWLERRVAAQSAGYFTASFRGEKSLVSYTSPDSLGWQYVRITPYDIITEQTTQIRNTTLLISVVILLAGLLISRILSKRLYLPIDSIVTRMNALEAEKRNSMFTIRQNALRSLVLGMKSPQSLRQGEAQSFGAAFGFSEGYRLVLLRIDDYSTLREERGSYLLPYKFAIMNIASEICGQTCRVETVDMNDDSVVMLLSGLPPAEQLDAGLIDALLRQIREACREYLKIGLSLVYSPASDNAEQVNRLYKAAREASKHRLFYGHGCIIDAGYIGELQKNLYAYPADLEKKLVEALTGGRTEEALEYFSQMLRGMEQYPYHVLELTLSRISFTIKRILDNIVKCSPATESRVPQLPLLEDYETLEQLEAAYCRLFADIQERQADKRSSKQSDLIRQINQKISDRYMDPSLSLNQIADELNMSPIYVSRLYKQQTMTTIVDLIMEVRMTAVCRLLKESDLSVSEIASAAGFTSSSYLHRMFKRSFSVTPIEFRRSKPSG
ncbi:AraC family transcriptional regulator [Paenibacillus donghaensis]|uniref:AraC family transcriptional regulator n=1 Tax=Paenibacillus donghaensis TaxID=414771 RepID=A0A2Z2KTE5_9BACL|nr:AraC family transcriptional regulator [Paenibacillus donghaensis]ASA24041.1 AraC family transcriptional regulator [Paenibacillus donghaensis]